MKLALVAFLAMCALVVSSPINEEKRTEEMVDLLRELLLVDMEDDRLQDAKRGFGSFAASPTIDPSTIAIVQDMWSNLEYSYVVLRIINNKWIVVGTGTPLAGGLAPSEATLEGKFNEMKVYLTSQPTVVLFKRGTLHTMNYPYAAIEWIPESSGLRTRFTFTTYVPLLMDGLTEEAAIVYELFHWTVPSDIYYDSIFFES